MSLDTSNSRHDPVSISGYCFPGDHPEGRAARLTIDGEQTRLAGEGFSRVYPTEQVQIAPRSGNTDRFLSFPDGLQFSCADCPGLNQLYQESTIELIVAWLEARVAAAVAAIVAIALMAVLGYLYGIPAAARAVVDRIPPASEVALGEQALSWLDENRLFAPTELDAETRAEIEGDFSELVSGLPLEEYYRLEFRRADRIGANAFALPGGIVVITDEMVAAAETFDEIAAILAHEIGHVEGRHSMKNLVQASAVAIVISAITSDAASLSVAIAGAPTVLAEAKYSRDFETEADDFAFERLQHTGRSPEAFASIMERLFAQHNGAERQLSFVSSHPVTVERIKRARAYANQ